jgi:hypothetical protein
MSDPSSEEENEEIEEIEDIKVVFKIFEQNKLEKDKSFTKVSEPRTFFEVCLDVKVCVF